MRGESRYPSVAISCHPSPAPVTRHPCADFVTARARDSGIVPAALVPFLTLDTFRALLPGGIADVLVQYDTDPEVFVLAEADAAAVASRLSGIAVPDDEAEAPAEVRRPVAHLIHYALIGTVPDVSEERMRWARDAERQARADLEALRTERATSTATTPSGPATGQIAGLPSW